MQNNQLITQSSSEKAWHVVSLLLSLGRAACPSEVASRCTLFPATPDLILSLCFIHNSPISLTNDLFVTLSLNALLSFAGFVARNLAPIHAAFYPQIKRQTRFSDLFGAFSKKRKRFVLDDSDASEVPLPKRATNSSMKVHYHITDGSENRTNMQPGQMSFMVNQVIFKSPLFGKSSFEQLRVKSEDMEKVEGQDINMFGQMIKRLTGEGLNLEIAHPPRLLGLGLQLNCVEDVRQNNILSIEARKVDDACTASNMEVVSCEKNNEVREKEQLFDLNSIPPPETAVIDEPADCEFMHGAAVISDDKKASLGRESNTMLVKNRVGMPTTEISHANKNSLKCAAKRKLFGNDGLDTKLQANSNYAGHLKAFGTLKEKQQCKGDQVSVSTIRRTKQKLNDLATNERVGNSTSVSSKDQSKRKVLPNFELYAVEEEEGSGGYGTVYRARSKSDGTVVAIKCPHANANRQHSTNELKMLERFGGRNFVIKYQGCFKSEDSDCFVLEHVEHDRPEMLKKDIDISQLQWYGYCLFRALASLHKQGIVHRDVKPGNFLFSRKANKGHLIDFNLAMDLNQKSGSLNKSKAGYDVTFNHDTVAHAKYIPPSHSRKVPSSRIMDVVKQEAARGSKFNLQPKNLKKKAVEQKKANNDSGTRSVLNSQGADGSGITSTKDVTSTKNPSAERLREPLPSQGRKELISLVEAMKSQNHEASHIPAPMRKRIAAPPGKLDRELVYLTPMPVHSAGNAVAGGAGLIKTKGNGKLKREGPCAGTKGFRAPEVLFRSPHQGPKLDVWSAGVTLLYLMIGRTPFFGDPEQNIKDIAKLRGSEDLWEVAKLHGRESSFPEELYDTRSLASMNLQEWCKLNTKRPEFLELIPNSLFDLVDKCLTVNPRLRLSAEDAFKHEFFAPCHESLKRLRLIKQRNLEGKTSSPSLKQSIAKPVQEISLA